MAAPGSSNEQGNYYSLSVSSFPPLSSVASALRIATSANSSIPRLIRRRLRGRRTINGKFLDTYTHNFSPI